MHRLLHRIGGQAFIGRRGIQAVTKALVSRGDKGQSLCQCVSEKPGCLTKMQSW